MVDAARQSDPDDALATPRPAVWENIQREIKGAQPPTPVQAGASHRSAGRRPLAYVLVAVFALLAGLGGGYALAQAGQPAAVQAARPVHLNALPSWPGAEGTAVVDDDAAGNRVLSVSLAVPEAVRGRMEVWLSDEKAEHMLSMGFMTGDHGTFAIPADVDISEQPVVDISLEPDADADPDHSGVSIVRGRIIR